MDTDFELHLTSNQLESYYLRRAPEAALEAVEEHLLCCERCRALLDETETEIRLLRIALLLWEASPTVH
jgi:predicted anti-sigma-YlaC factor YlaD